MLTKTITYTDFNGNSRTEELFFNMTRSELLAFSFNMPDVISDSVGDPNKVDMEAAGIKLAEKLGNSGIFKFVQDLVFKAYGVKSEDGRRFIKSDELSTEFTQTLAYDEFIMELFSDDKKASEFINSIIPADIANKMSGNNGLVIN